MFAAKERAALFVSNQRLTDDSAFYADVMARFSQDAAK